MIHLYEDAHHQLYLRWDDAPNTWQITTWHNGDFQKHAAQLDSQDKLDGDMAVIVSFDQIVKRELVATWYGAGVFTTEPEQLQPGSMARRYIGPFLIDAPQYMDAQGYRADPYYEVSFYAEGNEDLDDPKYLDNDDERDYDDLED